MSRLLLIPSLVVLGSVSLFAAVDRGLLAMVPSDARIVSSIDITQARSSDFGQYLLNRTQNEDHDFAEFVQETGFDPRRDLQSLIFESSGPAAEPGESRFAILARGNFDPERITATAKAKGATVGTYQGVALLFPQGNRQKTAVAFPDVGLAIMADVATMHRILDNRANPATLDSTLQQRIDQVASNNDAWFVSLVGGTFLNHHHAAGDTKQSPQGAQAPQAAEAQQALQSVVASSGGVRFGSTVDLTLDAVTRSPQDATSLADVVRFLASTLQMERTKDPRAGILASAVDNMNLTTDGNDMHLAVSIPEKSMEQLAELGPKPGHRGRQ